MQPDPSPPVALPCIDTQLLRLRAKPVPFSTGRNLAARRQLFALGCHGFTVCGLRTPVQAETLMDQA